MEISTINNIFFIAFFTYMIFQTSKWDCFSEYMYKYFLTIKHFCIITVYFLPDKKTGIKKDSLPQFIQIHWRAEIFLYIFFVFHYNYAKYCASIFSQSSKYSSRLKQPSSSRYWIAAPSSMEMTTVEIRFIFPLSASGICFFSIFPISSLHFSKIRLDLSLIRPSHRLCTQKSSSI